MSSLASSIARRSSSASSSIKVGGSANKSSTLLPIETRSSRSQAIMSTPKSADTVVMSACKFESMRLAVLEGEITDREYFDRATSKDFCGLALRVALGENVLVSKPKYITVTSGTFPVRVLFAFPYNNQPSVLIEAVGPINEELQVLGHVSVDVSPATRDKSVLVTTLPMYKSTALNGDRELFGRFKIRIEFGLDDAQLRVSRIEDAKDAELCMTRSPVVLSPRSTTMRMRKTVLEAGSPTSIPREEYLMHHEVDDAGNALMLSTRNPPVERFIGQTGYRSIRLQLILAAQFKSLKTNRLKLRVVVGDNAQWTDEAPLTPRGDARLATEFDFPFDREKRVYIFAHDRENPFPFAAAFFSVLQMVDNGIVACKHQLSMYDDNNVPRGFLEVRTELSNGIIPEPIKFPIVTEIGGTDLYTPSTNRVMSPVTSPASRVIMSPASRVTNTLGPSASNVTLRMTPDSALGNWFFDCWRCIHCIIARLREVSPVLKSYALAVTVGEFTASVPKTIIADSNNPVEIQMVWCMMSIPYSSQRKAKITLKGTTRNGLPLSGIALVDLDLAIYQRRLNVVSQIVTDDAQRLPICLVDCLFAPSRLQLRDRCRASYLNESQIAATATGNVPIHKLERLDDHYQSGNQDLQFKPSPQRLSTTGLWSAKYSYNKQSSSSNVSSPFSDPLRRRVTTSAIHPQTCLRRAYGSPQSAPSRGACPPPKPRFSLAFFGCPSSANNVSRLGNMGYYYVDDDGYNNKRNGGTVFSRDEIAVRNAMIHSNGMCREGNICYGPASYMQYGAVSQIQFEVACRAIRQHTIRWPINVVDYRKMERVTQMDRSVCLEVKIHALRDIKDSNSIGILNYIFLLTYGTDIAISAVSPALTADCNCRCDLYISGRNYKYASLHVLDASVNDRLFLLGTALIDVEEVLLLDETAEFGADINRQPFIKYYPLIDVDLMPSSTAELKNGVVALSCQALDMWPVELPKFNLAEVSSVDPSPPIRSTEFEVLNDSQFIKHMSSDGQIAEQTDRLRLRLTRFVDLPNPYPFKKFDVFCELKSPTRTIRTPVISRGGSDALLNFIVCLPCNIEYLFPEIMVNVYTKDLNGREILIASGVINITSNSMECPFVAELRPEIERVGRVDPPKLFGAYKIDNKMINKIICRRIPNDQSFMIAAA